MYFGNKFDSEFLHLANAQEPKGGTIRLDAKDRSFWVFRNRVAYGQPQTIHVIPLLLFNQIESTNKDDLNVENYMMICQKHNDTSITCYYDENVRAGMDKLFECDLGITTITGDLEGEDENEY